MKYHNKKIIYEGKTFGSKKEFERYLMLKGMQNQGMIQDLQTQVKYELIPAHYEVQGKKQVCIERSCNYYADFVYKRNGKTIVEDTKGYHTKEYLIKRKLMLWIYGIQIEET